MAGKLKKNTILFFIEIDGKDANKYVEGKGRNSVSQKVFGIRAFQAIEKGLCKSISRVKQ